MANIVRFDRFSDLDDEIDEAKSNASYADGVLQLTLPTKAKAAARRLAVN